VLGILVQFLIALPAQMLPIRLVEIKLQERPKMKVLPRGHLQAVTVELRAQPKPIPLRAQQAKLRTIRVLP
jgi:hypothetical protein